MKKIIRTLLLFTAVPILVSGINTFAFENKYNNAIAALAEGGEEVIIDATSGTTYSSLKSAIASVPKGHKIKFLDNYSSTESIEIKSTITIDLNNFDVSGISISITKDGSLTVKGGGTLSSSNFNDEDYIGSATIINQGTFIVQNSTISNTYNSVYSNAIYNDGKVYVYEGGSFIGGTGVVNNATLHVTSGSIAGTLDAGIYQKEGTVYLSGTPSITSSIEEDSSRGIKSDNTNIYARSYGTDPTYYSGNTITTYFTEGYEAGVTLINYVNSSSRFSVYGLDSNAEAYYDSTTQTIKSRSVSRTVSVTVSNCTYSGPTTASKDTGYTGTFTPAIGYALPDSIILSIGGNTATAYSWDKDTGKLEIAGIDIKGDIVIVVNAIIPTNDARVESWIDNCLKMDTYTESKGYCNDGPHRYYYVAKTELLKLGSDCITLFREDDNYNAAQERYEKWASYNNDTGYEYINDFTHIHSSNINEFQVNNQNYLPLILIACSSILGVGAFLLLKKKHR